MTTRPRILTGDTPTGRLHLGHYVGSLENRIRLQRDHDCYILIANVHAFTTRAQQPEDVRRDTIEIVRDQLAAGVDPSLATFVVQSEIPAIAELTFLLAMLIPFSRVMRNPTLKAEITSKQLGDHYSFGFPLYAVGQCADILAFRADLVPVGEDQAAHVEMTREVARRFAQVYGAEVFPVPEPLFGRVARLPGIDGVEKMSKSRGNAIYLSDSTDEIRRKMARLYTGRQSADEPGDPDNVLFQYARAFLPDPARVEELAAGYARGGMGDAPIKREVADAIDALVAPMRERRARFTDDAVLDLLREHARRANAVAGETLARVKDAMHLTFA
ncbi:MAG: tryptophan--tRNA ligase [Deltaproteobacteria bacterium]|nr:tryptophan--tRNA ligase [Kofleriaceae bacterium]